VAGWWIDGLAGGWYGGMVAIAIAMRHTKVLRAAF